MLFWTAALSWRSFCARTLIAVLAVALLLATQGQSQAADPEPKRVMMLHSFGLRFRPWTDYSEALRAELSRRASIEFQDHSLLNARRSSDKSDAPFVEYLRTLNIDQPPDLIIAIGAPAANFVQAHRKDLFPTTPMLYTLVERRRVDFDKLTKYDTVVAITNDDPVFFENILHVLPQTTTIAIVVGASPSETWWRNEVAKSTARFADRVRFRWYNELSFEEMLKDAANLPPHSAIFWIGLNVDAAGVAHEGNSAFSRFYRVANAPIFFHDEAFFGEGIVGGPMQVVARQSKQAAEVALRILDGENVARHQADVCSTGRAYVRLAANAAVGNCREQSAARQHRLFPRTNRVGTVLVASRTHSHDYSIANRADRGSAARTSSASICRSAVAAAHDGTGPCQPLLDGWRIDRLNCPRNQPAARLYSDQYRDRAGDLEVSKPDIDELNEIVGRYFEGRPPRHRSHPEDAQPSEKGTV